MTKSLLINSLFSFQDVRTLLEIYWSLDTAAKNKMLKELIERVNYTKDVKNAFRMGNEATFVLDIFPRIQSN